MAKVRLVKGPFAGKVDDSPYSAGVSSLHYRGPKPMTRKQRYEFNMKAYQNPYHSVPRIPMVSAEYEIAMTIFEGRRIPCQHPDGSYFYVYKEGSKREF